MKHGGVGFFFFKQKTAYEMRISDWSSDVCSSDLEARHRSARMLRTALGDAIAEWLADPRVIEIMLNPDGRLWVDRLGEGIADSGQMMTAADGERIIRLVAHHVGAEVHAAAPRVSAELPEGGERFEGLLPPVVMAPTFAIRKPAIAVFSLDDYVAAGIMLAGEAEVLRAAVRDRSDEHTSELKSLMRTSNAVFCL